MRPVTSIDDPRYIKALSHPLRVRILAILQERTASPVELAQVLEGTLGTVSYHVRTLHQLGLIELVDETRVRGAVEHHYKARARPKVSDEAWEQAPPIAKQAAVGSSLQMIDDYTRASAAAGGFDHADAALIRLSLTLDAKGWQQLAKACKRLFEQAQRIEADASERLGRGARHEQEPIEVGLVTMMFEAIALGEAIDGADRRHRRGSRTRSRATAER
jgi:DNA-binding transcriptional ArsR family regulator